MTETYEVHITRPLHTVVAGPNTLTVKYANREEAAAEFRKWTSMPEGAVGRVELVRVRVEVVEVWEGR